MLTRPDIAEKAAPNSGDGCAAGGGGDLSAGSGVAAVNMSVPHGVSNLQEEVRLAEVIDFTF